MLRNATASACSMNFSCKSIDRKASAQLVHFRLLRSSNLRPISKRFPQTVRAARRKDDQESRDEILARRDESDYQPKGSRMLSSRQHLSERKAKQAGYVALRGPGQDVLPTEREREQRAAGVTPDAAGPSGAGGAGSGAKPVTAAAKAAARRGAGPRLQGPPVPTIAPGQPAPGVRSKEKVVELPSELDKGPDDVTVEMPSYDEQVQQPAPESQSRGRITIYCIAETLNRDLLSKKLRDRGPNFQLHAYPDVLYGRYSRLGEPPQGDVFYFDYGCVAFWGLTQKQEQDILRNLVVPCEENPLPVSELEIDEFQFHYTTSERPHIQNDTITINHRFANDHTIKLSISHALAQSTKLCVFEERVLEIVGATRHLPGSLATTGKVAIKRKVIAQLIGKVFIQKAAVNLLSTVLDTPEFFWSAPDSMQNLYKRVCEYMELDNRVEVLNNRLAVLQEMLDMLRDHENNSHAARLEWIIIWLIIIEVVVGLFECASLFGWMGDHGH